MGGSLESILDQESECSAFFCLLDVDVALIKFFEVCIVWNNFKSFLGLSFVNHNIAHFIFQVGLASLICAKSKATLKIRFRPLQYRDCHWMLNDLTESQRSWLHSIANSSADTTWLILSSSLVTTSSRKTITGWCVVLQDWKFKAHGIFMHFNLKGFQIVCKIVDCTVGNLIVNAGRSSRSVEYLQVFKKWEEVRGFLSLSSPSFCKKTSNSNALRLLWTRRELLFQHQSLQI